MYLDPSKRDLHMIRLILYFTMLLVTLLGPWNLIAQQSELSSSKKATLQAEIDTLILEKMKEYEIPGLAIAIVKGDSILIAKGYGVKNIDDQSPVDENTTFHTASISKLFTAQAVVQLFESKDLPLNSRISELIPQLNYTDDMTRRINVKQLLNHTSGLPDIRNYQWQNAYVSDDRLQL